MVLHNDWRKPAYTVRHTSRIESGRWIRNEFCPQCGTTVSWTLEMRPGLRAIAGGSLDDPNWYTIAAHIWTRSARPDMCYPDHVEVHEQALPG